MLITTSSSIKVKRSRFSLISVNTDLANPARDRLGVVHICRSPLAEAVLLLLMMLSLF
jgi:DNA-binding TFAR19-related protein (PDSD5 family)